MMIGNVASFTEYIDCETFNEKSLERNVGRTELRFDNIGAYKGGGALNIKNCAGITVIYVPSDWKVRISSERSAANVNDASNHSAEGPELFVNIRECVGKVNIERI